MKRDSVLPMKLDIPRELIIAACRAAYHVAPTQQRVAGLFNRYLLLFTITPYDYTFDMPKHWDTKAIVLLYITARLLRFDLEPNRSLCRVEIYPLSSPFYPARMFVSG